MLVNERLFAHRSVSSEDREALLNGFPPGHPYHRPEDWEEGLPVEELADHETLAHVLARVGLFPSASQARKNGRDGPIAPSFQQMVVGKKKILVTIIGEMPQ